MASTVPALHLIKTKADLAAAIGVPLRLLQYRAFECQQSQLYSALTVRKRSGGLRVISAPRWPLLNIQREILTLLEQIYRPSSRVMGFVKGRGIKTNAQFHVGRRLVLNLDLADYFSHIHIGRVRGRLLASPYSLTDDVATTVARLCTLDGVLPMGAPTSPILANMLSSTLDMHLAKLARKNGCFYTRYADDITFSTNRRTFPPSMVSRSIAEAKGITLGPEIVDHVTSSGFQINPLKTKLLDRAARQEVCGLTCNEKLNVRRTFMRELRGAIHCWRSKGRETAEAEWNLKYNWRGAQSLERSIRGRLEHLIHIRGGNDPVVANLVDQFNSLDERVHKDVLYSYKVTSVKKTLEGVCLIECAADSDLEWAQGTGFIVGNGSIITNSHVVSYKEGVDPKGSAAKVFPEIRVTLQGADIQYDVAVVYRDEVRDIAVLKVADVAWGALFASKACPVSFGQVELGQGVVCAGFPGHQDGSSIKVNSGHVTGSTKAFGQTMFSISQPIVKGNSGGPIIDENGQVIGIATRGVEPDDAATVVQSGCIPMYSLAGVLAEHQ